jgi:tetratricopeptide (TPR) repeat protein
MALARQGRREAAFEIAREALRNRRDGAERAMGRVCAANGDHPRALLWYERAAGRSDGEQALRWMGRTLLAMGDYREAAVALERSIRASGFLRTEDVWKLGECLRKTRRERLADEIEQRAWDIERAEQQAGSPA